MYSGFIRTQFYDFWISQYSSLYPCIPVSRHSSTVLVQLSQIPLSLYQDIVIWFLVQLPQIPLSLYQDIVKWSWFSSHRSLYPCIKTQLYGSGLAPIDPFIPVSRHSYMVLVQLPQIPLSLYQDIVICFLVQLPQIPLSLYQDIVKWFQVQLPQIPVSLYEYIFL